MIHQKNTPSQNCKSRVYPTFLISKKSIIIQHRRYGSEGFHSSYLLSSFCAQPAPFAIAFSPHLPSVISVRSPRLRGSGNFYQTSAPEGEPLIKRVRSSIPIPQLTYLLAYLGLDLFHRHPHIVVTLWPRYE